jgi:flagellar hook-associated protein 3 FlgL
MRISTSTFYASGSSKLGDLQTTLLRTQQQIATGRKMLTPADDPVSSARAYDVSQAQSANAQFGINRDNVKLSLGLEEDILQSITGLLQDVKTATVAAGNGVYSNADRKFLATEIQSRFDELLTLANSGDGQGGYLFAGFQSHTQPFTQTASGAQYNGDQGSRLLQVSNARQIAFSDSGDKLFELNKTGNGIFTTSANAANTGAGVVSSGLVADATLMTGENYSINFTVAAGVTTYDVVNTTTGTTLSTGNAYASGQPIVFDGLQLQVSGNPANGDSFGVEPSKNQSIFTTLRDLINLLNMDGQGEVNQARLTNGLNTAHSNLDNGLENILTARAEIGSRLKEIDSLDGLGEDLNLQFSQTLSDLQDLDYNKAISSLVHQQTVLTAAQQSFAKISGLSLFNFI